MKRQSNQIFDRLTDEFSLFCDRFGFEDLTAAEILSFWRDSFLDEDREFLIDFIERWHDAQEIMLREQICERCRRYTPEFCLEEFQMRSSVCPECLKSLKAVQKAEKQTRERNRQPSFF